MQGHLYNMNQRWAYVNTVMNLQVPYKLGNGSMTIKFSKMTLVLGVSESVT
jgi:hypothetical protein